MDGTKFKLGIVTIGVLVTLGSCSPVVKNEPKESFNVTMQNVTNNKTSNTAIDGYDSSSSDHESEDRRTPDIRSIRKRFQTLQIPDRNKTNQNSFTNLQEEDNTLFRCDFESDSCILSDREHDLSWIRTAAHENRTTFKPISDVSSLYGHFMMVDLTGAVNKSAIMQSKPVSQRGHKHFCLSYWYYMHTGQQNSGSMIVVYVFYKKDIHNGHELTSIYGGHGPYWYHHFQPFKTEVDVELEFLFLARQGNKTGNGTIAFDDVKLELGDCEGPVWQEWAEWSKCSETCGNGTFVRYRICDGLKCEGPVKETEPCSIKECPSTIWSNWSNWSKCSVSCGTGKVFRSRECKGDCTSVGKFEAKECDTNRNCTTIGINRKTCGIPKFGVIGGKSAKPGAWPWHAGLYRNIQGKVAYTCGATIVSKSFLVTAAHCVFEMINRTHYRNVKASRLFVRVGSHRLVKGTKHKVQEVIPYHKYRYLVPIYDIALLKLEEPISNIDTAPLCLPRGEPKREEYCYSIGWGKTQLGSSHWVPTNLQEVKLKILNDTKCKEQWGWIFYDYGVFCAGENPGQETVYKGDSGGPMICQENGVFHLQGVTSMGDPFTPKPAIYSDVWFFKRWIEDIIQEDNER